jgi:hypothetical protein
MPGSMNGVRLDHAIRDRWPPVELLATTRWGADDRYRCPGCRGRVDRHIHGRPWRPIPSTARLDQLRRQRQHAGGQHDPGVIEWDELLLDSWKEH